MFEALFDILGEAAIEVAADAALGLTVPAAQDIVLDAIHTEQDDLTGVPVVQRLEGPPA